MLQLLQPLFTLFGVGNGTETEEVTRARVEVTYNGWTTETFWAADFKVREWFVWFWEYDEDAEKVVFKAISKSDIHDINILRRETVTYPRDQD